MLDLHCHLLPGVDDGAPDMAAALAMGEMLNALGFTAVAASPHAGEGPGGDVQPEQAAAVAAELRESLRAAGIPLAIMPNAEHMLTPLLFERLAAGRGVPVGGGGKWLLVELPWGGMSDPEAALFRLQTKGYQVLLAHPERYDYLRADCLSHLVARGIKLQLEAGSFSGEYGFDAQRRAEMLADRGCAHVLATDLHTPAGARERIESALAAVRRRYGEAAIGRGFCDNPTAIVAGAAPDAIGAIARMG